MRGVPEFLLIVDFFAAKNSVLEFSSCQPYQGQVACGQSSLLVFEWEWCAIDKDLELA